MREILFRGKQPVNGEWAYGSLISKASVFDKRLVLTHIYDKDCNEILVNPETIGQYTGRLVDFGLERIFEGDIVRVSTLFETPFIGVVYFLDCKFCIVDTNSTVHYRWMDYDIEVIGNIYDNFELLKGEIRE